MGVDYALTLTQNQFLDLKAFALVRVRDVRIYEMPSHTVETARLDSIVLVTPMSLLPESTTMTWQPVVSSLLPFRKQL
jgi:hypothetical protein